jgi:hypothetical protein
LYLIEEHELPLLSMNGCNRIVLTNDHLPNGLADEIMNGPDFSIPSLALNYIYRPTDEAVLAKNPHLKFLPTE